MPLRPETARQVIRLWNEWKDSASPDESDRRGRALSGFLSGLTRDECVELVALVSVGRGDPGSDRFQTLKDNIHMDHERASAYLMDKMHLSEYLEKGLKRLGLDPESPARTHA